MPRLRTFLHGCFAYATFLYFLASVLIVKEIFRSSLAHPFHRIAHKPLSLSLFPLLLWALGILFRMMPVILTVTSGMAWWTLKAGKASGRVWAIAASTSILLASIALLVAGVYIQKHGEHGHPNGLFLLVDAHLFVGLAGVVEFAGRNTQDKIVTGPSAARISGDGTSKALDALALVIQLGGVAAGMSLYMSWSRSHHLHVVHGYLSLIQVAIILVAVTVIHESAHAFTGLLLGMKLCAFVIGPLQWRHTEGRWHFRFRPRQFLAVSGAAGLVPTNPNQSRWIEIATIAAGPLSNLFFGAISMAVALSAQGRPYESLWEFFALFATISFVIFVVNLIPFRPDSLYSDGARIYQILRGGPLADYHRILSVVASTLVTPIRSRDYDIRAIERASASFTSGPRALRLRLLAARHYFDCGSYLESSRALAAAERIDHEASSNIAAEIYAAVVMNVLSCGDSGAAHQWWNKLESTKPAKLDAEYWLAKCAVHWTENDANAANEAWNTGYADLQKHPEVGAYNFVRDCFSMMKGLLGNSPIVSSIRDQDPTESRALELLTAPASD